MPVGDYSELDEFRGDIQQPDGSPIIPQFVRYEAGTYVLIRPTAQQLVDANPELGGGGGNSVLYTAQTPTAPQQAQARSNVGLGTAAIPQFAGMGIGGAGAATVLLLTNNALLQIDATGTLGSIGDFIGDGSDFLLTGASGSTISLTNDRFSSTWQVISDVPTPYTGYGVAKLDFNARHSLNMLANIVTRSAAHEDRHLALTFGLNAHPTTQQAVVTPGSAIVRQIEHEFDSGSGSGYGNANHRVRPATVGVDAVADISGTTITGTGSAFGFDMRVGDAVSVGGDWTGTNYVGGWVRAVSVVDSNTQLTVSSAFPTPLAGQDIAVGQFKLPGTVTVAAGQVTVDGLPGGTITGTGTFADDFVNITGHGLTAGRSITCTVATTVGGTGFTVGVIYHVIADGLTADKFKVSLTAGGTAVDIGVADYTTLSFHTGSKFSVHFAVGSRAYIESESHRIASITSDILMTLATAHKAGASGASIYTGGLLQNEDWFSFNGIRPIDSGGLAQYKEDTAVGISGAVSIVADARNTFQSQRSGHLLRMTSAVPVEPLAVGLLNTSTTDGGAAYLDIQSLEGANPIRMLVGANVHSLARSNQARNSFSIYSYYSVNTAITSFHVDTYNHRVGIGNVAPTTALDVTGTVTATTFAGSGASLTGVPVATGISGLGAGVATFLATPSSANLLTAVTDETGSGPLVFATIPTLTAPVIADFTDPTKTANLVTSDQATSTAWNIYTPNANTHLLVSLYSHTITGPSAARTITIPDANFTVARTDAANTFTGAQTFGGVALHAAGNAAGPGISFSGDTNTGLFSRAGDYISLAFGGTERMTFGYTGSPNAGIIVSDTSAIGFNGFADTSSGGFTGTAAFFSRGGNATIHLGANAAGVTDYTLKASDRITSDGVGANLTIAGGRNRGASVGGSLIFQTSPAAGAGVTGTLATRLTIDSTGLLTIAAGSDIALATATGTKIGTATNQLLAFYGVTPVDQPATVADPSGGGTQDAEARTAIIALIDRLQELGLIA